MREDAVTSYAIAVRVFAFEVVSNDCWRAAGNNNVSSNALDVRGVRYTTNLRIMLFTAIAAVDFHRCAEVRARVFQHCDELRRNAVEFTAAMTCKLTPAEMLT